MSRRLAKMSHMDRFMEETTIHGFREIHRSKTGFRRTFWFVAMLIGLGLTVWFVVQVAIGFHQRPILTSYTVRSAPSMKLPKFQICLSNPVDKRRVRALGIHEALIRIVVEVGSISPLSTVQVVQQAAAILRDENTTDEHGKPVELLPTRKFNMAPWQTTIEHRPPQLFQLFAPDTNTAWKIHKATAAQAQLKTAAEVDASFRQLETTLQMMFEDEKIEDSFAEHYRHLKPYLKPSPDGGLPRLKIGDLLKAISFTAEDVLTVCKILNSNLTCPDISTTVEIQGGQQCYEINIVHNQTMGGFGLMALINVNDNNAYEGSVHGEDAVWLRLDKNDPASSFMILKTPVGRSMKVILNAVHYYHAESKHLGTCVDDVPRYVLSTYYSDNICRADCMHAAALRVCNCTMRVPLRELQQNTTYKYKYQECTSSAELNCVATKGKLFTMDRIYKYNACTERCKPACDYWSYGTTVTYGRFPSHVLKRHLAAKSKNDSSLFDHHILLEYAFETLQYSEVRQTPALTRDAFVSQIGGQLSLFLGASILSLVHFTAWLIHSLFRCLCDVAKAKTAGEESAAAAHERKDIRSIRRQRSHRVTYRRPTVSSANGGLEMANGAIGNGEVQRRPRWRYVLRRRVRDVSCFRGLCGGDRDAAEHSSGEATSSGNYEQQNGEPSGIANGVWYTSDRSDYYQQYYSAPMVF